LAGSGPSSVVLGEGSVDRVTSLEQTESSPESDRSALDPGRLLWIATQRRDKEELINWSRRPPSLSDLGVSGGRQQRTTSWGIGHVLQQYSRQLSTNHSTTPTSIYRLARLLCFKRPLLSVDVSLCVCLCVGKFGAKYLGN